MAKEIKLKPECIKSEVVLTKIVNYEFGELTTPVARLDNWDYYTIISESRGRGVIICWNEGDFDNAIVYMFRRE